MNYFTQTTLPLQHFNSGILIRKDGFLHHRRTINCHILIFVIEGCLHITSDNISFHVSKGQYIFLRADTEHYGSLPSEGSLSYFWVHFNAALPFIGFEEGIPHEYGYLLPEYGSVQNIQRIHLLFRQLIDVSRREVYSEYMYSYALSLLMMELTQEYISAQTAQSDVPSIILIVKEWIKSNCHRELSLPEIAAEFHYNPEYLSALFRKSTGITLTSFINKSRIDISKLLLSDSNISIKEIAFSCGFNDEKYYMKTFRKYEGITPMQYRNAVCRK